MLVAGNSFYSTKNCNVCTGSEETLQVPATEDDIDAALSTNKRFKEIGVAHTQISDMLSEECAHLLRKAQAATSKAASAAGSAK